MNTEYITYIDAKDYFSKYSEDSSAYALSLFDPCDEPFFVSRIQTYEEYSKDITSVFNRPDFGMLNNPLLYSAVCTREHSFFFLSAQQNHSDFSFIRRPYGWCFDYKRFPEEVLFDYDSFSLYEAFLYFYYLIKCASKFPSYKTNALYVSMVREWAESFSLARRTLNNRGIPVVLSAIYFSAVSDEIEVPIECVPDAEIPRLHKVLFEPVGRVDPIRSLDASPTGWTPYKEVNFDSNGQVKLWISEVKFLLDVRESGRTYSEVVYLGSSPGYHLEHLVKFFPSVKFVCYDPNFSIYLPTVEYGDMLNIKGRDWKGKDIVVVSDIYVKGDLFKLVDDYLNEFVDSGATIVAVLEKQFVDFNRDHTSIRIGATILFEPFLKGSSGEMRSFCFGKPKTGSVSSDVLESGQNFFRQRVRCAKLNADVYSLTKCGCVDCLFLSIEVGRLSTYTGKPKEVVHAVRAMFKRYDRPGVYYSNITPFKGFALEFSECVDDYIGYYSQFGHSEIKIVGERAFLYIDLKLVMTAELKYYPRLNKILNSDRVLILPMRILFSKGGGYTVALPVYVKGSMPYVKIGPRMIIMNEANRECVPCRKKGEIPTAAYCAVGFNEMNCGCTYEFESAKSVGSLASFAEYLLESEALAGS